MYARNGANGCARPKSWSSVTLLPRCTAMSQWGGRVSLLSHRRSSAMIASTRPASRARSRRWRRRGAAGAGSWRGGAGSGLARVGLSAATKLGVEALGERAHDGVAEPQRILLGQRAVRRLVGDREGDRLAALADLLA